MIDANELIIKIKKHRDEYEERDQGVFDAWLRQIDEAEAKREFAKHFLLQERLKRYGEKIKEIDDVLCTKYDLDEIERKIMLKEKDLYTDFIDSFNADHLLEEIARETEHL